MSHEEIVTQLSMRMVRVVASPSEIIYAITMQSILSEIARRMGERALTLSVTDLHQARNEVRAAIGHYLDEREYIDIGLDCWEITRNNET